MIATYRKLQQQRAAGEIDGFTLIELLIVIVVLGTLAAVVIFALGGIVGQSAVAACQADAATISTALATFNTQNPSFSGTTTYTIADLLAAAGGGSPTGVVGGPYLQSWPSNIPHYEFTLTTAGVLQVNVTPKGAVVAGAGGTTAGGAVGAGGTYVTYTGPNQANGCAAVS